MHYKGSADPWMNITFHYFSVTTATDENYSVKVKVTDEKYSVKKLIHSTISITNAVAI